MGKVHNGEEILPKYFLTTSELEDNIVRSTLSSLWLCNKKVKNALCSTAS